MAMTNPDSSRMIKALDDHEWEASDDHKHLVCVSCGKRHRADTQKLNHRKDCPYAELKAWADTHFNPKKAAEDQSKREVLLIATFDESRLPVTGTVWTDGKRLFRVVRREGGTAYGVPIKSL